MRWGLGLWVGCWVASDWVGGWLKSATTRAWTQGGLDFKTTTSTSRGRKLSEEKQSKARHVRILGAGASKGPHGLLSFVCVCRLAGRGCLGAPLGSALSLTRFSVRSNWTVHYSILHNLSAATTPLVKLARGARPVYVRTYAHIHKMSRHQTTNQSNIRILSIRSDEWPAPAPPH